MEKPKVATPPMPWRPLAGMQKRPQPLHRTVTELGRSCFSGKSATEPSYDPLRCVGYAGVGLDGITLSPITLYDGGINDLVWSRAL